MDFSLTAEQRRLRDEARAVASAAVANYGWSNDSWVSGYSKEFASELAMVALAWSR